jgi:type IV pilus assembly protein PilM
MAHKNDCWGVEIGANAIKAIQLVRSGTQIQVADYAVLPFKKVLTTPDLNVDEAIQVNLDTLLAQHDLSKSRVIASVPGHMAFARFAKLPPVEPKEIPKIVQFEAVQQIPFPIEDVEWDYQVFQQEDSPDVEVGIFAITKDRVSGFLNNFRRVNLEIDALTLSPLAVFNAFAFETADDSEPDGSIYMDIGTTCTDLIIVENGGIWLRTLPIGGNNFTEALVKAFKISFPKAEKLKREASTSKYARNIFQAMRPIFADLVQEIQRSLGYYQSLNRDSDIKRMVGVGSTFRLPGLQKFLKQQLQMDVVRPDKFSRITVEGKQEADFADNVLNMATAYGLSLQGLELGVVSTNILPAHVLKQRLWKAKQPWFAAAAACVAIAVGLGAGRLWSDSAAFASSATKHDQKVNDIITTAGNEKQRLAALEKNNPLNKIVNLERILDYRDLWPKILEDISLATAAIDTQEVLLGKDYEAIANIPRAERLQIFIETIEYRYIPVPIEEGMDSHGDVTKKYKAGFFFDSSDKSKSRNRNRNRNRNRSKETASDTDKDENKKNTSKAPRLEIIVRGTTPYGTPAPLLTKEFIGWLKENAERPDRPYRLVIDDETVLQDVNELGSGADAATTTGGRGSAAAASRRQPRGRSAMPGLGMPGGRSLAPGGFGAPGAGYRPAGASNFEDLLAQRPLSDESKADDHSFTIVWIVELKNPQQARAADDAGATPAPPGETPQATPGNDAVLDDKQAGQPAASQEDQI